MAVFLNKKGIQPAAGDASMNKLKYINALVNVTQVRVQMKQTEESYKKMSSELEEKLKQHQARSPRWIFSGNWKNKYHERASTAYDKHGVDKHCQTIKTVACTKYTTTSSP